MKDVSKNSKISVKEAETHYQSSKENYAIDGTESHLAYYREKYHQHFEVLLNNVSSKI